MRQALNKFDSQHHQIKRKEKHFSGFPIENLQIIPEILCYMAGGGHNKRYSQTLNITHTQNRHRIDFSFKCQGLTSRETLVFFLSLSHCILGSLLVGTLGTGMVMERGKTWLCQAIFNLIFLKGTTSS